MHPRWVAIQVHGLDDASVVAAQLDEVAKVLESDVALATHAERLIATAAELLNRALETDAERVGREAEDLASRAGDPGAVGMDVVDGRQLGRDLGVEAVGERVRNLAENVEACCDGCVGVSMHSQR